MKNLMLAAVFVVTWKVSNVDVLCGDDAKCQAIYSGGRTRTFEVEKDAKEFASKVQGSVGEDVAINGVHVEKSSLSYGYLVR